MRRFFKTVSVILLCGLLSCPVMEARGRNNAGSNSGDRQSTTTRPAPSQGAKPQNAGTPARPGGNSGSTRPGNSSHGSNGSPQSGTQRPGHTTTPQRPGTPSGSQRPSQSGHQPSHQPDNRPVPNPGYNPGPGHNPGHNFGPGHNYGPGPAMPPHGAPYRPYMPPPRPFARPVPPPAFCPRPGGPSISTILGITLGTALNLSINALINSGHSVTGYSNDAIYLTNAYQLNMLWPNATMYYNNGFLTASDFVYSTPYYDTTRYYQAYNALVGAYGLPVSSQTLYGGGMETTWFGYNGQFVRLQYQPMNAYNGTLRYYTTLAFGN